MESTLHLSQTRFAGGEKQYETINLKKTPEHALGPLALQFSGRQSFWVAVRMSADGRTWQG